jgi:hypothetical protein
MKSRIIVGSLLVFGLLSVGTIASRGAKVAGTRTWTLVNFVNPVTVQDAVIMGPVMIVHDDAKMAKGEPCTTFYRFDPSRGPREELASFHCKPVERAFTDTTILTLANGPDTSCKRLIEYQIAGDVEAHGVPAR